MTPIRSTALWLGLGACCAPAFGQATPAPRTSVGMEVALGSGHADRGFVISDRPVFQPVVWISARLAEFSVWGNLPLAQTTDGQRPQILELELSRERKRGNLTIAPAIRAFFYHDPLSIYSTHSIEGWLTLSYGTGPVKLITQQSIDVLTYRGAYYGEAGIKTEGPVSQRIEVGGSLSAGWASSKFNAAYVDVAASGWQRVSVAGWLTAHVTPHYYIGPHIEFSRIVNPRVRATLARPSFLFVGITTGIES